jgi:hypothetical protein
MSAWEARKISILDLVGKNGPLMKELKKPQIMLVKHKDYGVRKLWRRIKDKD